MLQQPKQWFFIGAGWISLVLAIIGIPLPLLPTTPFLLLAAYCFTRGSPRLHHWLMNHPQLGPPIHRWQAHGAISRRAKWLGSLSLLAVIAMSLWFGVVLWVVLLQVVILLGVASFLWTRPEPPESV